MDHSPLRRSMLVAAAAAPFVAACSPARVAPERAATLAQLRALEQSAHGRLGVAALDTSNGARIAFRAREHFPLCGTFAVAAVAALLARAALDSTLLPRRVLYRRYELVPDSPVTGGRADTGMLTEQLCAATLQAGDKSAANLLLGLLGGPRIVTEFAHAIGNTTFRLDRWEPELDSARPGDERDTGTPVAMADMLNRLLLGNALPDAQRAQLSAWMTGNAGGAAGIRAGLPADWRVAHLQGNGGYGTTNDIAVVWPPSRAPLVLAIYFTQPAADAAPRDDVVASAARLAVAGLTG